MKLIWGFQSWTLPPCFDWSGPIYIYLPLKFALYQARWASQMRQASKHRSTTQIIENIVLLCWSTLMKFLKQCELNKNHLSMTKSSSPRNLLNLKSVTNFKGFEAPHNIVTSIKHGKKKPQSFFHCGSFDHPDLQSHDDYKNLFFILRFENLKFIFSWGMWYTIKKVFSRPFRRYITSPKIPKVSVGRLRKQIYGFLSNCRAWWSKEPQWENECGSFSPCFLLVCPWYRRPIALLRYSNGRSTSIRCIATII